MVEHVLLARVGGLITHQQALDAGMSARTIARRLATKEWHQVFPGVYRHCAATVDDELMVRAAMLWGGPDAVLSGGWAAWWHGFCGAPEGAIMITVSRTRGLRSRGHVHVRRRDLTQLDIVTVRGIRVVSRALAALESTELVGGEDILDRALQRFVSIAELTDAMGRYANATGSITARKLLAARVDGGVSAPERELLRALRAAGLTQVTAGMRVRLGDTLVWFDFAVESLRLAIEVDGVKVHSTPEAFHRDRKRQNVVITHQWLLLRYTPLQIRTEIDRVIGEITQAIQDLGG